MFDQGRPTSDVVSAASPEAPSSLALIDWLAFTVTPPEGENVGWIDAVLSTLFGIGRDQWKPTGRGWNGYSNRVNLGEWGLLGHGGVHQKGTVHVSLNGHACARVGDWSAVRQWGEDHRAVITRVDLAHDDFEGSSINVEIALQWFHEGRFTSAGRPPAVELRDDLGTGKGKTLYFGNRSNGKLLRVYEKGRQLGDPTSPWVRAEVELHNKSRVVPWEVLTRPAPYLAGAYPALRYLSAEQCRIRTIKESAAITFVGMVDNLSMQGGKGIHMMRVAYKGDCTAIVDRLEREGRPKRLEGIPEEFIRQVRESK